MTQQAHSINSYDDKKTVNFLAPLHILNSFDTLVKANGTSRTSMIVAFMKSYIKEQLEEIEDINAIDEKITQIKKRNFERVSKQFEKKLEDRISKLTRKETIRTPVVTFNEPVEVPKIEEDDIFKSRSTWTVVGNDYDE